MIMNWQGHLSRILSCIFLMAALAACSSLPNRVAVPEELASQVKIEGINEDIRVWGDALPEDIQKKIAKRNEQMLERLGKPNPNQARKLSFLAISGGGPDGAFGAGLLNGWTKQGTRPEFEIVTGISTGALIAPFAFLGSEYDEKLKQVYTQISSKNIIETSALRIVEAIFGGVAIGDTLPFCRDHSQKCNKRYA